MSDTDIELGPIDYLVVEWPKGKEPSGEGLPILVDLVDRGVVPHPRLFAFVQKNEDGTVSGVCELDELGGRVHRLRGRVVRPAGRRTTMRKQVVSSSRGASAALLLYENTWAAPFATAAPQERARSSSRADASP